MRKYVLIALIAGCLFLTITAPAMAESETETHIILLAKDVDTEIELIVDDKHMGTRYLQPGINYMAYKTDAKPDVKVIAYGDTLNLKMTEGNGNDRYTFHRVMPPVDGDGKLYE